jgi:thiol peroxidase
MATITVGGNPANTIGELPAVGSKAPAFFLIGSDLEPRTLTDFAGKRVLMNIFTSIDTSVCAASLRRFNETAAAMDNVVVLNISADLPFALNRFCAGEGIENAITLSTFRGSFGEDYGVKFVDGKLAGLCARSVVVLDGEGTVTYTQQVPENAHEPNYDDALAALG